MKKRYRHIYNKLTNFELQINDDSDRLISQDDIFGELEKKNRPRLLLNFYSEDGIQRALEEYGIFNSLKKRGFKDFIFCLDTDDPYLHKFRAYFDEKSADHLLCEVYLRKKTMTARPIFKSSIAGEEFTFIVIEWLLLQDPTSPFSPHRPPLPGQKFPGLKIGRKVLNIFMNMCIRLKTDGLINIPEHYHNAAFYSRHFSYFNPETEGYFRAIRRDLANQGLNTITWAMEWDCVVEAKSGNTWKWITDDQILPVSPKMESYFKSKAYKNSVEEYSQKVKFFIDDDEYERKKALHEKASAVHDIPG